MKRYKFLIKETKEKEIEISAKNHSQAMIELLVKIAKDDKNFWTEDIKEKKELFIKVKKIIDEKGKENLKDYDDFIKENRFFISKFEADFLEETDEDIEENEDNFLSEYDEIICEKCGNCIRQDKDL